jgi:hypothetical protein
MKKCLLVVCVLALSGWGGMAMAGHKSEGAGTLKPVKIVQGTLKAVDRQKETVTIEVVGGQSVTVKIHVDALEQLHRTGKAGERVELRLDADDVVQVVAVGLGP